MRISHFPSALSRFSGNLIGVFNMAHQEKKQYAKKHPPGRKVKPRIVESVKKKAKEGKISCSVAFEIVKELDFSPDEVGFTLDSLEIKIIKCQLGIFGYNHGKTPVKPLDSVSGELKEAIEDVLEGGRLPCKAAWEIAERLGIGKTDVTAACEKLKLKISSCQLGGFRSPVIT
jgi:hypothetical protein